MRLLRPPLLVLALLALAVFGLSACGGGGGSATTDATEASTEEAKPALTKEELIRQGDALCAEVNTAVGSVGTSAAEPTSQATQVANLYVGMVTSLERLGGPREGEAEYAQVISAAENLAKVEGEVKLAAERGDSTALAEAEAKAGPAREEFQTQAGVFGFEHCSQGPSAPTVAPSSGSEGSGIEEGGVEAEEGGVEEYVPPAEEGAIEEVTPEGGGAGVEEEAAPEGGGEENSSGGVGPG